MKLPDDHARTPRGHDLTLLQELQELTPAERIARNCAMVEWIEKLQAAAHAMRPEEIFQSLADNGVK